MRLLVLVLAGLLLSGCESMKDSLVRWYFVDQPVSNDYSTFIKDELERKMSAPPPANPAPRRRAPDFLDQG